jgi:hypothetical protein
VAIDLSKFKGRLPYDSQLYGIYQPLIGWRSRLIQNRLNAIPVDLPPFPPLADIVVGGNKDLSVTLRGSHQNFRIMADGSVQGEHAADVFKDDPSLTTFDNPGYIDSLLVRLIQQDVKQNLPAHPPSDAAFWSTYWANNLSLDALNKAFNKAVASLHTTPLVADIAAIPPDTDPLGQYVYRVRLLFGDPFKANEYLFNKEVYVARYLNSLLPPAGAAAPTDFPAKLNSLLLNVVPTLDVKAALDLLDPLYLSAGIGREAVLSPIGIIHIFRQYYFEFDTFLGPPVEHVWLSPGSTTEMIEVSTRRVLQEYTLEQLTEQIQTSETSTTTADELSTAVQDENQKNTKLGATLSGGVNILVANVQASGSTSVDETQKNARQENHKTSRQQTAKLSSELRSSFKSTFRTVTEATDTRSKRYTITNPTNELINYELRRKMRQIGVQVQDLGTQLCWQVYVDDPGRELGVAQLVHVAAKSDLSPYVHAPMNPAPDPNGVVDTVTILVPVPNPGDRSNLGPIAAGAIGFVAASLPGAVVGVAVYDVVDSLFGGGKDKSDDYSITPQVTIHQQYKITMPDGYQLAQPAQQTPDADGVFTKDGSGDIPLRWLQNNGVGLKYHMTILNAADGVMDMVVNGGKVTPGEIIEFQAMIRVVPTADKIAAVKKENDQIAVENSQKDMAKDRAVRQDFVNGVKERVKFAAGIKGRPAEDLREEERTVIYRALLQRLMKEAWSLTVDRKVAHLRSELIKSIFDVDRMLYFVAPEWWQARLHESRLDITMPEYNMNALSRKALTNFSAAQTITGKGVISSPLKQNAGGESLATQDLADWGGEGRPDNYLITEDSNPARLGSSLGWLLQLDGDNLRNAFLNAPWVNAIIPILPGREQQAIEWLKQSQVEGADGLDDVYAGDDKAVFKTKYEAKYGVAKDPTVEDTLLLTADDIQKKQNAAFDVITEDVPAPGGGPALTISYLRQDQVFEKGFDPLAGGFKAAPQDKDGTPLLEVFDQWMEILPTDQVVAVPVAYDPKTGLMI